MSLSLLAVGIRIRTVRKSRKVSQEKLAELAGLHPIFISNVENLKVKASICTYNNIALSLDMTLAELVEMPVAMESFDEELVGVFQSAKKLDIKKQKIVAETIMGLLVGLEGSICFKSDS